MKLLLENWREFLSKTRSEKNPEEEELDPPSSVVTALMKRGGLSREEAEEMVKRQIELEENNRKTGTLNSDYPGYVEVYSPYSKNQKIAHVGAPGDQAEILGSWSDKGMKWLEVNINGTKGWIEAEELDQD